MKHPVTWPGENIKNDESENIFKSLNKKIERNKANKKKVTIKLIRLIK